MNRSLKLPLLIALALGSTQLMAVDLGQIQVKSALGQPLLAEIPVHAATPAELQHLSAQLASSDEFARAGIAGGRTTIPLHFSVADATGGRHVIRITSAAPVDDPFLDLLVEVNAPSGKSVREFAILLDPPGAAAPAVATAAAPIRQAPPAPAQQSPVHAQHAQTATGTVGPAPAPASAKAAATKPAPAAGQYGPIARGDTLSSVARRATPAGVDIHQMLLAIKQANPDAFYRDNINALKTGAILRMPTATEAQTVAVAAAIAEVRRQNGDWSAKGAVSPATVADTATRASASSAPTSAAADTSDRLALVPAKEGADAAGSGAGGRGGKGNASATALRRDLLRAQESLASVQQQSADLQSRVKDLTDINDKNTRLLSLKDSEIADLQAKLAAREGGTASAAGSTAAAPAAKATTAATIAASATPATASAGTTATPAAGGTAGIAGTAAPAAANTPAAPASTAVAATGAPAAAATAPAGEPAAVTPWYMQTWAWAAGAGAIVLLALLGLFGRRRKTPAAAAADGASSSLADRFVPASVTGAPAADDTEQDELLDQLAERPDDVGLHLELVTLYYSRRDVDHFEAAAEAMHAHIVDPQQDEWQDVVHMGEDLVPGHPLFDHHVEPPAPSGEDPLAGFDIDDYADTPTAAAPAAEAGLHLADSPKPVGGYAFDFDLTTRPVSAPTAPAAEPVPDAGRVATPAPAADSAPAVEQGLADAAASTWEFAEPIGTPTATAAEDLGEFNDDPVDTKLDLARAYLDMGDAEGARAMLDEVIKEGSQTQQDVARELLGGLPH